MTVYELCERDAVSYTHRDVYKRQDVFGSVFQHQSTPLALGAEGDGGFGLPAAAQSAEACPQSLRRGCLLYTSWSARWSAPRRTGT